MRLTQGCELKGRCSRKERIEMKEEEAGDLGCRVQISGARTALPLKYRRTRRESDAVMEATSHSALRFTASMFIQSLVVLTKQNLSSRPA